MKKSDVSEAIDKLDRLLFGPPTEKKPKIKFSLVHLKNLLKILVKADIHLLNNIIKANVQIGPKNVIKLLFIIIRVVDEMQIVNQEQNEEGV